MSSLDELKSKIEELEQKLDNVIKENIEQRKDIKQITLKNQSLDNELKSLKSNLWGMLASFMILPIYSIPYLSNLDTKVSRLSIVQAELDNKITKVDNTIENISSEVQSKSQEIDELNIRVDKLTDKESKNILSTTKVWSAYKGLKVTNDEQNQQVILNCEFTTECACYSKELSVEFKNYGGKILRGCLTSYD